MSSGASGMYHHRRSPYRRAPDFAALAARDTRLAPFLYASGSDRVALDFSDPAALAALTGALLAVDWGVPAWSCPLSRLVPALPSRLSYVLWVQDLLAARLRGRPLLPRHASPQPTPPRPLGIDVGTGASAILALLCASAAGFRTIATEEDELSAQWASRNTAASSAGGAHASLIRVVRVIGVGGGEEGAASGDVPALVCDSMLRDAVQHATQLAPAVEQLVTAAPAAAAAAASSAPMCVCRSGGSYGLPPSVSWNQWGHSNAWVLDATTGRIAAGVHSVTYPHAPMCDAATVALVWRALLSCVDGGDASATHSSCTICVESDSMPPSPPTTTTAAATVDFCVCNPPFFPSWEAALSSMSGRVGSAGTGTASELSCEGGEVGFVQQLIEESAMLK